MRREAIFLSGLALFFSLTFNSYAQEVFLGPKLGISVHKAVFEYSEDEDIFDQKIQFGYQIGGAFSMPLKNIFGFYSELYFSQKGKKTVIVENGLENQSKYYFIEAPIMLRLNFQGGSSRSGTYNYHFDFGPTVSYWLGGTGTIGQQGFKKYKVAFDKDTTEVSKANELVINGPSRWQWGLNIGGGIEYPIKKGQQVFVDLRLVFGNTNLIQNDGYSNFDLFGYDDDLNVRFRQVVISAAYMFSYDWRLGLKGRSTINKRKQY